MCFWKRSNRKEEKPQNPMVLLTVANTPMDMAMIQGILKDNSIQFYVSGVEAAIVVKTGALGSAPAEISVMENDLEKAQDLIEVVLPKE